VRRYGADRGAQNSEPKTRKIRGKRQIFQKFFRNFSFQKTHGASLENSQNESGTRSARKQNSFQKAPNNEERVNEVTSERVLRANAKKKPDSPSPASASPAVESESNSSGGSSEISLRSDSSEQKPSLAEIEELQRQKREELEREERESKQREEAERLETEEKRKRNDAKLYAATENMPRLNMSDTRKFMEKHAYNCGIWYGDAHRRAKELGSIIWEPTHTYVGSLTLKKEGEAKANREQRRQAEHDRIHEEAALRRYRISSASADLRHLPPTDSMEKVVDFIFEHNPDTEDWVEVWQHAKNKGNAFFDEKREIYYGANCEPESVADS
jgi:hypothetical protein